MSVACRARSGNSARIVSVKAFMSKGIRKKTVCADPDGDVLVEKLGREGRSGDDGPLVDALEMPDQHEGLDETVGLEVCGPTARSSRC